MKRGWALPTPPGEAPTSWVLFQGCGLRIGAIRVSPRHPRWHRLVDNHGWPAILFPRTVLRLGAVHGSGGVVDPGCAYFVGSEARYAPTCLTDEGDRSDWFSFSAEGLARLMPALDPDELCAIDGPLHFPVGASELRAQRRAFRDAVSADEPDTSLLEEAFCLMIGMLAEARRMEQPPAANPRLAHEIKIHLARRIGQPVRLTELAREFGVSVAHLCRTFRAATGGTIHSYGERLRLATALERLEDPACDLTDLALDLGYSSHAHLTTNFRRAFGTTPSAVRGTPQGSRTRFGVARGSPRSRKRAGGGAAASCRGGGMP